MKHKVGDTVRIRSKEWLDSQERNRFGNIEGEGLHVFTDDMRSYAGKLTKITELHTDGSCELGIGPGPYWWEDWMFDSDYRDDGSLPAEEAFRAMLDGDTLYDKEGRPHSFTEAERSAFSCLRRQAPESKRPMTRWEILDWANSEASRGWAVCRVYDDGSKGMWVIPQWHDYTHGITGYQRARLRPDLSGVDEDTIQGFEVEEALA